MKTLLTTALCFLGLQVQLQAQINQTQNYQDFERLMDSLGAKQDDIDYILLFVNHKTLYFDGIAYSRTGRWKDEIYISTPAGWYVYPDSFFIKYSQSLTSKEHGNN